MTDFAFGSIPKDQHYSNLNVKNTLGQCSTRIRAQCMVAQDVTADTLTVTTLDAQLIDIMDAPLFIPASAQVTLFNNGGPGFVDNAVIPFDVVQSDNAGIYNVGSSTFTVPRDGLYKLHASICATQFAPDPAVDPTSYGVSWFLNGAELLRSRHTVESTGLFLLETTSVDGEQRLVAGDTLQVRLHLAPNSGAAGTVNVLDGAGPPPVPGITYASLRLLPE